ncbi:Leucine-rich repeat-containing protein 56 [Dissostichus eleginoides]|uniref:Leucine-rich repeat-containing protein 56 n=1 Tax=Dissostichus eleginoides TaxID=100907 RepID=A0AAD9F392_DISEL|nr:Leucine-rich repeat-containing protein 56 [Dissostichus eleginoides]
MSCCHGSVPKGVRPGTARVLVTELSGSGHINPTPATKPCEDAEAVDVSLSPEKLKSLCGTQDLSHLTSLEICLDTQENTLGNFGAYLPKLVRLKMNNSTILSVRDLGTTLSHLEVLWMSRCSLQHLDGLSTLSSLKELYLAYNNVSDLSQAGMLENLQLLDLEGNDVDDLVQIQYLGLCGKLQTLTLEGNPVCVLPNPPAKQTADYSYRAAVRELIPQLRYLDDVRVEEDGLSCSSTMGEDWDILRNSIRDCNSPRAATDDEDTADSECPYSRPSSARRPPSSLSCVWPLSSADSRPHTGSRPILKSSNSGSRNQHPDTWSWQDSVLWKPSPGHTIRREKLKTAPSSSTFTPRDLPIHVPEHSYDLEEPDVRERVDVFAELRSWREQHSKRLQAIETGRLPQVLAIMHSDEEEGYNDDEEEGFGCVTNDSSDEEHGAEKHGDSRDAASPVSSFQSLSPDLHHREALSPEVARLSLSPDTTLYPSRPLSVTLTTGAATGDTDLASQRVQQQMADVPLLPLPAHKPHPPLASALGNGLLDSCGEMDISSIHSVRKLLQTPQMSKLSDRPAITRPHTARAALQKHQQHHTHQPCRGSSHPD